MSRLIAALQIAALLVGLVVVVGPAEPGCCPGAAEMHGASCCEAGGIEAKTALCCEEDAAPLGLLPEPLPPTTLVAAALPPSAGLDPVSRLPRRDSPAHPRPPDPGLFTLHSAWLL